MSTTYPDALSLRSNVISSLLRWQAWIYRWRAGVSPGPHSSGPTRLLLFHLDQPPNAATRTTRSQGSYTCVSLNSSLESNKEEEEDKNNRHACHRQIAMHLSSPDCHAFIITHPSGVGGIVSGWGALHAGGGVALARPQDSQRVLLFTLRQSQGCNTHLRPTELPAASHRQHTLQGYLAHKNQPTSLGPPWGPRHSPTVGS